MELLYATGLRVSELVSLPAGAVRREVRYLTIRIDQDLIDDPGGLDLGDCGADRIPFVVGRQDYGDALSVPHDQAGSATMYIWAAIGRQGEFR